TSPAALPDKATPVPEGSSLDYFLKIDGIAGDSTDAQHKGEFAVDGLWLDRRGERPWFGRRRRAGDILAADRGYLLAGRLGATAGRRGVGQGDPVGRTDRRHQQQRREPDGL